MRRLTLLVHAVLAAPAALTFALAALAALLALTRLGSDPHGFATATAVVLGAIVGLPLLVFAWLTRRWWSGRGWMSLAIADLGLVAVAAALLLTGYVPGRPLFGWAYGALAVAGAVMLYWQARRPAS
jgi:hypothetical protein